MFHTRGWTKGKSEIRGLYNSHHHSENEMSEQFYGWSLPMGEIVWTWFQLIGRRFKIALIAYSTIYPSLLLQSCHTLKSFQRLVRKCDRCCGFELNSAFIRRRLVSKYSLHLFFCHKYPVPSIGSEAERLLIPQSFYRNQAKQLRSSLAQIQI